VLAHYGDFHRISILDISVTDLSVELMASSRASGARLDQNFSQAREPIFLLSPGLKLSWVNRAWEELTGRTAEAVVGLVCRAHGPSDDGDLTDLGGSFYPPLEAVVGRPTSVRTLIVHTSGERLWRRIEYRPLHGERGVLSGLIGFVQNVDAPSLAPDAESFRLRTELLDVRDRMLGRYGFDRLVGRGPAHRRVLDQVAAAAGSSTSVLIVGEPGTGKRLVARCIHRLGSRPEAPIVPVDCAALASEMLDATLFGPLRPDGSLLILPEAATLVLINVLEMPRDLQGRLASSLDGRNRVVATSSADPDAALLSERLRPDLYYALTTLMIHLSPLRDRLDEIPLFSQHFLELANRRGGRQHSGFAKGAINALLGYDWPGNLCELSRVIDDAHQRGTEEAISEADLPAAVLGNLGAAYPPPATAAALTPLDELMARVERRLIEDALKKARHNKSRAAELLGVSRPRLYRRIKELDLPDLPETPVDPPPDPAEPGE